MSESRPSVSLLRWCSTRSLILLRTQRSGPAAKSSPMRTRVAPSPTGSRREDHDRLPGRPQPGLQHQPVRRFADQHRRGVLQGERPRPGPVVQLGAHPGPGVVHVPHVHRADHPVAVRPTVGEHVEDLLRGSVDHFLHNRHRAAQYPGTARPNGRRVSFSGTAGNGTDAGHRWRRWPHRLDGDVYSSGRREPAGCATGPGGAVSAQVSPGCTPVRWPGRSQARDLYDAVLLDRDGTLIEDVPYNGDPDEGAAGAGRAGGAGPAARGRAAARRWSPTSRAWPGGCSPRSRCGAVQRPGRGAARPVRHLAGLPARRRRRLRLPQAGARPGVRRRPGAGHHRRPVRAGRGHRPRTWPPPRRPGPPGCWCPPR